MIQTDNELWSPKHHQRAAFMKIQITPWKSKSIQFDQHASGMLGPEHFASFAQCFKAGGSSSMSQCEGPRGNIFASLSSSLMLQPHSVHACACVWHFLFSFLSSFHCQKWELTCLRYFPWELCLLSNVQGSTDLEYHTDRWPKKTQRSARVFLLGFYLHIDQLYY